MSKEPRVHALHNEAVPLTVGQLGMWVFLSTEAMFFVALIAATLVLRLAVVETAWPTPAAMGVSLGLGLLNTVLLLASGLAAYTACAAARRDRPLSAKFFLVLAMSLGCVFLTLKFGEYRETYRLGLFPSPAGRQIFEKPDLEYVSQVDQRLAEMIAVMERQRVANPRQFDAERLDRLYELKSYLSGHTAMFAGRGGDPYRTEGMIRLMARQIFPHADTTRGEEEVLELELYELHALRGRIEGRLQVIRQRIPFVEEQIESMSRAIEEASNLGIVSRQSADPDIETADWLAVKEKQLTQLNVEKERLELGLKPITGRIRMLEYLADLKFVGFNHNFGLRLPVVVANGHAWMSIFLLLTGMHALHLIAGLLAFLRFIPVRLDSRRAGSLYVTSLYWQFVDIAWLAIFWIVYF